MSDWKNNPAITAIVADSIVLTTTLFVVYNYVIPVYQLSVKKTILELQLEKTTKMRNFQKQKLS